MDIKFACSNCGQHILAAAQQIGITAICPNCGNSVIVPNVISLLSTAARKKRIPYSMLSSAFGIIALLLILTHFGSSPIPLFTSAVLAIAMGHFARTRVRTSSTFLTGRGTALLGIILGYASLIICGTELFHSNPQSLDDGSSPHSHNPQSLGDGSSQHSKLMDLIKHSRFSDPIAIRLPAGGDSEGYESFKQRVAKGDYETMNNTYNGNIHSPDAPYYNWIWQLDNPLLAALSSNGFVKRDDFKESYRRLIYSQSLIPYTIQDSKTNPFKDGFGIMLGHRVIKSIDYTNSYSGVANNTNAKVTFYTIRFTYAIEPILPGLPHPKTMHVTTVKGFRDPDDGLWKLWENIQLPDKDVQEFIDLLPPVKRGDLWSNWPK